MVFDPCAPTDQSNIGLTLCGIFVSSSSGSDSATGDPDHPLATLAKAVELAAGKGHVYACNKQPFKENLVITTGVTLFGGLDCDHGWAQTDSKTMLTSSAGVPLSLLSGAEGVRVKNFDILAPDGGMLAGSSIAVISAGAAGAIEDSTIKAGDAFPGDPGVPMNTDTLPPAPDGVAGGNACSGSSVAGGVGPQNTCGDSIGGKGGDGGIAVGGAGDPSLPLPGAAGGVGDTGGGWTCGSGLGAGFGHPGLPGTDGAPGEAGLLKGQIDADGYHGADGGNGDPGQPGQGGGGGGGRSGPQCSAGKAGAAGGSGAPGGCGGKGGGGGKAGGSSIGILIVTSTLKLENVVITAGNGGPGGQGGKGQYGAFGGKGGPGGTGTLAGCAGGDGGNGGNGGAGGGGRGGHSIGIAHDGSFTSKGASVTITVGSEGPGGLSGDDTSNNAGMAGVAEPTQPFP